MNLLQAFDLGRKCGRAEKDAEGTQYQAELFAMTQKARAGIEDIQAIQIGALKLLEASNGPPT